MAENTIFGGATGLLQAGSGRRATLRDILLQEATSTAPVRHWLQGANRVAQGLLGGALDREARERAAADSHALLGAMGGGASSTPTVSTPARQDTLTGSDGGAANVGPPDLNAAAMAIRHQESGSPQGNYGALGPVMGSGDRAYGAYQVMGNNVGPWTERHFGQRLTPQQFLASREAQDAVFRGEFGDYMRRFGPEGASRAWFAGVGGMNRMGRSDGNMNVGGYGSLFGRRYQQYLGAGASPAQARQMAAAEALAPAEDVLTGGDGSDTASPPAPAASVPASAPLTQAEEDAAWAERQRLAAVQDERQRGLPWPAAPAPMQAPMPQARPTAGAGDMLDMAQANPTGSMTAPTEAPVPMARPQMPVPVPMARPAAPNALPAGAVPAGPAPGPRLDISRALGISDRDRLMMLRDEGSLAPGEADRLRGAPVEMMGRAQAAAPAGPGAVPAAAPISPGAGGFLAPVNGVRDRLYELLTGRTATPAAQQQQMAQANGGAPAGMDARRATLMRLAISEDASPQVRAMAMQQLQQMQPDTQVITTPDGAIIAVDKRTGQVRNLREAARPPTTVSEGQRLVDPQTGRVIAEGGQQRTNEMRNYDAYVTQERAAGRQPRSFEEYQQRIRRESSGLDTPDESFQKELGKQYATQIGALAEDGRAAAADAQTLAQVQALLGDVTTGGMAELKRRMGEFGINFEGTDRIQALNALLNRLTPQQRVPGSGATSDFDAKMFRDSLPRLINTPEGNQLILQSMNALIQNRIERAQIAGQMITGQLSRTEGQKRLDELLGNARGISERIAAAARPLTRDGASTTPPTAPAPGTYRWNPQTGKMEPTQ